MTREHYLSLADSAIIRAERIADTAEHLARNTDKTATAEALAAAGTLWADIARSHARIANAMRDDTPKTA